MTAPNARRWRLVLGRYADDVLPRDAGDAEVDGVLGYLYDREYTERGHRHAKGQGGSLDPSAVTAVSWLGKARLQFPRSTLQRMESDALTRYGLNDLLADPGTAADLGASPELASALLRMKGRLAPAAAEGLRVLVTKVVADIVARLRPKFTTSLLGLRDRTRRSLRPAARDLDWRRTIAANLRHVDPASGRMLVEEVRFAARRRRANLQWHVVVLVDQSGSMADSLLHAAVAAAIMAGLPGISVRLVLFDTSVVDVSHLASDPVEVLLTAQLGGGTDIAKALAYAETLVTQPTRTVVAVISDFDEGGSVATLLATARRLTASGVRLLGLASLADDGEVWFNHHVAQGLVAAGAHVAAMTPDRFAEWLAEVMV